MKHHTIVGRTLLFLLSCGLVACVEPPTGSTQATSDQGMEPAPDMSSGDGDMSTEEDMETPRSGEIQLIITPNLTSIEVGRAIEVEAVYVVDGALQPGVTFEWFLGEETQTSEVLRLENKGDQTVTALFSPKV